MVSRGLLRLLLGLYPATASLLAKRIPKEAAEKFITTLTPKVGEAVEQLFQQAPQPFRTTVKTLAEEAMSPTTSVLEPISQLQYVIGTAIRALQQYPKELYTRPALPRSEIPKVLQTIREAGITPKPVYHVTTDLPAVLEQGLRLQPVGISPSELLLELSKLAGKPLPPAGLGTSQSVAAAYVTVSKEAAINAARTLKTATQLARNEISLVDAILKDLPILAKAQQSKVPNVLGDAIYIIIDQLAQKDPANISTYSAISDRAVEVLKWKRYTPGSQQDPRQASLKLTNLLQELNPYITEKLDPETILRLYQSYLKIRQEHTGIADPYFVGTAEQYQQLDPHKIGVLEIYTLPYTLARRRFKQLQVLKGVPTFETLIQKDTRGNQTLRMYYKTHPDETELRLIRPKRAWIFESTILPLLGLLLKLQPNADENS